MSSREIPLLRRLADYRALERTLGLDEVALYHMTLHRFASHLQSPKKGDRATSSSAEEIGRPLLSISTVRRVGVSLSDTKICLDCLEEEPGYDRLFWRLRPVILCTRHSLLLVDHCPNCSASIPGLRPSPGSCPYCRHGEYRQVRRESVSPSSWLHVGQTLLLHVLMAESTGVVVRALKRLAWEDDQNVSASPTTREVAFQIALFHYLLASWPENLLTALDTVVTKMKGWQARGSMLEIFRQVDRLRQHIWSSSSYGDTAFDFLLQVFETLFAWATISVIPLGRGEGFSHE